MPPRSTLEPLECSDGTRPSQAISCRGVAKRRKSPTSAASTTAERKAMPRIACKAVTTGASDQSGTSSLTCWPRRSRRCSASLIASICSCSTICWAGWAKRSPASQRRWAGDQVLRPVKTRPWRRRKPWSCCLARRTASIAAVRARTRSRIASWAVSGTQTAVSVPVTTLHQLLGRRPRRLRREQWRFDAEDDVHLVAVDLDPSDQDPDQSALLLPVELVEVLLDPRSERLEPPDDQRQLRAQCRPLD